MVVSPPSSPPPAAAGRPLPGAEQISEPETLTFGLLRNVEELVWAACPRTPAWTQQPLGAFPLQPTNGPCGVLSSYSAELVVLAMECERARASGQKIVLPAVGDFRAGMSASEVNNFFRAELHIGAMMRILERCAVAPRSSSSSTPSSGNNNKGGVDDQPVFRVCVDASFLNFIGEGTTPTAAVSDYVVECVGVLALRTLLMQLETTPRSFRVCPLGCLRLVYSMVLTRGLAGVRSDVGFDLMSEGLISPPFGVCSSELMGMFFSGKCSGNFGVAPGSVTGGSADGMNAELTNPAPQKLSFGLLTNLDGYMLAAAFKNPEFPVFVLHGGDHYTLLFGVHEEILVSGSAVPQTQETEGGDEGRYDPVRFRLWAGGGGQNGSPAGAAASKPHDDHRLFLHWNGLPPAGPRLCALKLSAEACLKRGPSAPKDNNNAGGGADHDTENGGQQHPIVLAPGEIEEVVQAHKDAGGSSTPDRLDSWLFEVALRIDSVHNPVPKIKNENNSNSEAIDFKARNFATDPLDVRRLDSAPAHRKNLWRCRACYETRFTTMCFGQNELPAAALTEEHEEVSEVFPQELQGFSCRHCERPATETGWTLFLTYDELPKRVQRQMQLRYGPKIATVLANRWEIQEDGGLLELRHEGLLQVDAGNGAGKNKLYWPSV